VTFQPLRMAATACAIILASAAAPASAVVIKAADYGPGSFFDTAAAGLGPGTYRFSLTLTTPVDFVDGYAEKLTVTNFFCIDPSIGPDEFSCGGDDVPTQPLWDRVTPTLYQASITVNPFVNQPVAGGGPTVRYTEEDFCCTFQYGWEAPGAGSYVLSYAQVPEPESWALMIAGFGLLGVGMRRRSLLPA
jgi:hypothetical protein